MTDKTTAMTELPEPELGYIETDKGQRPAFSARQMREALQSAQPAAAVSDEPELTSKVVNDACWKFVKVIPHALPGPIWNDLKPAMYAALMHYHRAILTQRPQAVPMTPASRAVIMATRTADGDADEWPEPWAYRRGWNDAEAHHCITQRPQAVPMTADTMIRLLREHYDKPTDEQANAFYVAIRAAEAHRGITQRADGGEKQA